MRGGVGAARLSQEFFALPARRELLGAFTIGLGLNAKPLFKRKGWIDTSSLNAPLLSFLRGGSATGVLAGCHKS